MSLAEPLWKQCVTWLCQLKVLPENHCVTGPQATIQHLAYVLRDGVLLCQVIQAIDPSAIEMKSVNQRPQNAQFLCIKNIRVFLAACREKFDIKETDLFHHSMLYDFTDFARVLHTLSKLSNCPKVRALQLAGVNGFPISNSSSHSRSRSTTSVLDDDDEQIYRTLEEMVNEDQYQEFYFRNNGASGRSPYYTGEKEEGIYQDLCSLQNIKMKTELMIQPKEKRDYCIKELVETESNYVDVLNMLRKHFIRTITTMRRSDKDIVFMNIIELGETHAGFYQNICDIIARKSSKKIGEVFLEYKTRFLKYGEYCASLPKAHEVLDNALRDDLVREEVARCEKSANDGKFKLRDLLAVPMQRILKYHLLLRELRTHTAETHEEYHTIHQAYEAMLDVSEFINEVKRDSEQLAIIKLIENSINDWDMPCELKDYGGLRKDGELKIQSHESGSGMKPKVRFVFVFDKVMLMCKPSRGDHYSFKHSLSLSNYKIEEEGPVATLRSRPQRGGDSRWGHTFLLVHNNKENAYTLYAKTEDDKKQWIEAIRKALNNVFPIERIGSTHKVVMHTFKDPSSCDYCHKLFKGLFYQGYKCDKCGRFMHRQCISRLSKCGTSLPPSLPPRPMSIQLPESRIPPNRFSSVSLDDPIIMNNNSQDYINTRMEDHTWYVTDVDRESANSRLADYPTSTFLVRPRTQGGYALSLKTSEGDVKHMKILTNQEKRYCLSDKRTFASIVELVNWYMRNSLKECFNGLNITLRFPISELSIVVAEYDYNPTVEDNEDSKENGNKLPLRKGQKVIVIDKCSTLWWKAFDGNQTGYIPKEYVRDITSNPAVATTPTPTSESAAA